MAHEFVLKFEDPAWYSQHREELRTRVLALPSFEKHVSDRELWLRAEDSPGHWSYDLRIFLDPTKVLIEVTTFSSAFFQDVRALVADLQQLVATELADDDGEVVSWQ